MILTRSVVTPMRGSSAALMLVSALLLVGCTSMGWDEVEKHPDTHYAGGKEVVPPYGFIDYCLRDEKACGVGGTNTPRKLTLTPHLWTVLSNVNIEANSAIRPLFDDEHYGRAEYWIDPPNDQGDCEDYAIRKHNLLLKAGLPEDALLFVASFQNGEAHAVLWVVTDHGELVLDNLTNVILPADETSYRWQKGQTRYRPWAWREIGQTPMPYVDQVMKEKPLTEHVPFVPHDCRNNNLGPVHCGGDEGNDHQADEFPWLALGSFVGDVAAGFARAGSHQNMGAWRQR